MDENGIRLFEDKRIRTAWDEEAEEWYFSVVDVVGVLTGQPIPRNASTYWAVLKKRLSEEGADQLLTICKQLKLKAADGKRYDRRNTRRHGQRRKAIVAQKNKARPPSPKGLTGTLLSDAMPGLPFVC
jgi:hypothetical protein